MNGPNGGISVNISTSVVTVQTLQQHPFVVGQTVFMTGNTVAAYNSAWTYQPQAQTSSWTGGWVITAVPDAFHFQFQATFGQSVPSGAPGITNWGWGESAYLFDIKSGSFPQPTWKIELVDRLTTSYFCSDPSQVAMVQDLANGVLKVPPGCGERALLLDDEYRLSGAGADSDFTAKRLSMAGQSALCAEGISPGAGFPLRHRTELGRHQEPNPHGATGPAIGARVG